MVDKPCKCQTCKCGKEEWTSIEEKMTDFTRPFTEDFIGKNKIIRKFDPKAEDHLFKWHIDPESRIIKATKENDWKFQKMQFQFDNNSLKALLSILLTSLILLIVSIRFTYIIIKTIINKYPDKK